MLSEPYMMRIIARRFAILCEGRSGVDTMEFQPGATVASLVRHFGIPGKEAAVILLNSPHADVLTEPADGMTPAIFPSVGGG